MRGYRGKRIDNGEWEYGFYHELDHPDHKGKGYIIPSFASALYSFEVDPETVGQYTGCLDFYGGDIARSPGGAIGMITWHDSWCGFYFKQVLGHNECGELVWMISSVPLYNDLPRYTKLGNIHDNPELLGEVRE